jgi:N-acetylglutamate synthase-like GNAT family acetyltransferase
MAVADAHARHGVGSRLYEHMLARASALGIQRLYTTIRVEMIKALT